MKNIIIVIAALLIISSCENCKQNKLERLGLSSWAEPDQINSETTSIYTIIDFVNNVTCKGSNKFVKEEDRIAVFDMDGTIACECPVSMETICSYYMAYKELPDCDPNILTDTLKKDIADSIYKKRLHSDSLVYRFSKLTDSLINKCIPADTLKGNSRLLSKQFYKPMVELIQYLKSNKFQVYIVSGSAQQFIWGVIENESMLNIDHQHIIGSLTDYDSIVYNKGLQTKFFLDNTIFINNSSKGKSKNIYNRINKTPILAFGNTVNDFDMFALTKSNKNTSTLCILLNHDSDEFEAVYNPYDTSKYVKHNWNDSVYNEYKWTQPIFDSIMNKNPWLKMDMSKVFKKNHVFID